MILVNGLRHCVLPGRTLPAGRRRRVRAAWRRTGPLDAGVHVGFVIEADIDELVSALQSARDELEADVVAGTIAADGDKGDLLVLGDLAATLEGLVGCLCARDRRGRVLECAVNPGHAPRAVGVDCRRYFHAARCVRYDHRALDRVEHLAYHDRLSAACTEAMTRGKALLVVDDIT